MNKEISQTKEKLTIILLVAFAIGQGAFYAFWINSSVKNVVARQNYERLVNSLQPEVAALEAEYFNKQSSLTQTTVDELRYVSTLLVEYVDLAGSPIKTISRGN